MPTTNAATRTHLQQELSRLTGTDAFSAFGLTPAATPADIRTTFLQLTKRYHPSRFARMERDVVRLANEVFLQIKDNYTALYDPRTRQRLAAQHTSAESAASVLETVATEIGDTPNVALMTSGDADIAPSNEGGAQMGRVCVKAAASSAPAGSISGPKPVATAKTRTSRGQFVKKRAIQKQVSRATVKSGSAGRNVVPRHIAERISKNVGRIGGRGLAKGGGAVPTTRTTGNKSSRFLARERLDTTNSHSQLYERSVRLVAQGKYREARELMQSVVAENPASKKYRVQLHYAWGLEHECAEQFEDARMAYQRANRIDPTFRRVLESLERVTSKKGLLAKLFRR